MISAEEQRLPRRFVVPADRLVFLALGTWAVVEGVLQEFEEPIPARLWLRPLWPALLAAGGVLALVFLVGGMRSFPLRSWAGTLMIVACAGRSAALTLALQQKSAGVTAIAGVGAWSMAAFLLYITWRARLPWDGRADEHPGR